MPTYVYECPNEYCSTHGTVSEFNVPISHRDLQDCSVCTRPLRRKIAFKGLTWAPTAGGYR